MYYLCSRCNLTLHRGGACPACGKKLREEDKEIRFLEPDFLLKPKADKKEIAKNYQVSEESIQTLYFPYWNVSVHMDQDVVYTLETIKDDISSMKTAFIHINGGFWDVHYETVKYKEPLLQYLKNTSFEKVVEYDGLAENEFMVLARDDKKQKGNHVHQIVTDLLTELGKNNEQLTKEGRPVCDTIASYDLEECSIVLVPVYMIKEKGRKCVVDAQTGEILSDNKPAKKAIKIEVSIFLILTILYGIIQYFVHYQLAVTIIYILLVFISAIITSVPEDALEKMKKEETEEMSHQINFNVIEIVDGQKELSYFMKL